MGAWVEEFLHRGMCLSLDADRVLIGVDYTAADAAAGTSFYAPDFYLDGRTPWLVPRVSTIIDRDKLLAQLPDVDAPTLRWQAPDRNAFRRALGEIGTDISDGRLVKAVPITFETARGEMTAPLVGSFLRKLLAVRDGARAYGVWGPDGGMIGRSPELLFAAKPGLIESDALAGTRRVSDAAWDDRKELHEHDVVVQDLRNTLGAFGRVSVGTRGILSLGTLEHFRTPVAVATHGDPDFACVAQAMHPTAALGVYPRAYGWRNLRAWESEERGRFGAPFGARQPDGSGLCLVAIRNLQWRGDRLAIGAGCGIVGSSVEEREWAEVALKRQAVKGWLGL